MKHFIERLDFYPYRSLQRCYLEIAEFTEFTEQCQLVTG